MYKAISKQLNLDERQSQQLKIELENKSWLYSDSFVKRALTCYGYALSAHLIIALPVLLVSLLFSAAA